MLSCDECGVVSDKIHDLQRHVKMWCPEECTLKRKRDDEYTEQYPAFKHRLSDKSEADDQESAYMHQKRTSTSKLRLGKLKEITKKSG